MTNVEPGQTAKWKALSDVGKEEWVNGATCKVTSPVQISVDLPADTTSELVFRTAKQAGLQVRGIEVRRESVEAAFLRVLGEQVAP